MKAATCRQQILEHLAMMRHAVNKLGKALSVPYVRGKQGAMTCHLKAQTSLLVVQSVAGSSASDCQQLDVAQLRVCTLTGVCFLGVWLNEKQLFPQNGCKPIQVRQCNGAAVFSRRHL